MELYHSLYENTKNLTCELSEPQVEKVLEIIPKLDPRGHEILFFLIRFFHNQQNKDVSFQLPYQAKQMEEKQFSFDLKLFPAQLQNMVHMFVRMHYEYLNHEQLRK